MFFGIPAYMFSLIATAAGTGADNISVSVCLYSVEASSVICKNPSYSDNVLISFVLLKLVLVKHKDTRKYLCYIYY